MYRLKHLLFTLFLSLLVPITYADSANANADFSDRSVLIVHSYHANHEWTIQVKNGFETAFSGNKAPKRFHEFLDSKRFPEGSDNSIFLDYIADKYQLTPIDIIVAIDDPALDLIINNRQRLLPAKPVVYGGINRVTGRVINQHNMTGVFEYRDLEQALNTIHQLMETDEIVVISDSTQTGQANSTSIRSSASRTPFSNIVYIQDINPQSIQLALKNIEPTTPLFFVGQMRKAGLDGTLLTGDETAATTATHVPNPIFSIANGIEPTAAIAYHAVDAVQHSQSIATMVIDVLSGTDINTIPAITEGPDLWVFNAETLADYGIDPSLLPANATLVNHDYGFYEKHKTLVWTIASIFLVAIFIILLLVEVIRRGRLTRLLLQENNQRYRDLANAGAHLFWELDDQLHLKEITGNSLNVFGLDPKMLVGKDVETLIQLPIFIDFPAKEFIAAINRHKPVRDLLFKAQRGKNDILLSSLSGKPIFRDGKFCGYRGICKDVSEEVKLSQQVRFNATYDALTHLYNRLSFSEKLESLIASDTHQRGFLCFIDLDNFRIINDTAGHLVGDAMLTEQASRIKALLNDNDIVGRVGGDEFGAILLDRNRREAEETCQAIIEAIKAYSFSWQGKQFSVGASIGIVNLDPSLSTTEHLSRADLSCNRAKTSGRRKVYFSDTPNDLEHEQQQLGYIANISQSLSEGRFYLCRQSIVEARHNDNNYQHIEVLIRYQDDHGNQVSPAEFIPAAEKHGLIQLIDEWVVSEVLSNYYNYFPEGNTRVSINISALSICDDNFMSNLARLCERSKVPTSMLCFEITETAVLSQINKAKQFINRMKRLGVKFALDDFGSGACSYAYLKELPVDYIKIDGSLVKNIEQDPISRTIVESIGHIAALMGVKTIAEYVETDACRKTLMELRIDYVQGYGIDKPSRLGTPYTRAPLKIV